MKEFYKNDNYTIFKERNTYQIEFVYPFFSLLNSILQTHMIRGAYADEGYKVVKFQAYKVRTFKEYLQDYKMTNGRSNLLITDAIRIFKSLVCQLSYLIEKENTTFIGYNIENIFVINDEIFLFLDCEILTTIDTHTRNITITQPYTLNDFFISPELLKIKEIPIYVHYKTSYFSLCMMILYLMVEDNEFYNEYVREKKLEIVTEKIDTHYLKDTSFLYILSRCLIENPNNRSIILI